MPATLYDTSVWVALAFSTHPAHAEAKAAFATADSVQPAAFCRATQQSFLRLVTTPALQQVYSSGVITNDEAWGKWELLMALPQVTWLEEPPGMELTWQRLARLKSASPKRWMDAYLAALAHGHGLPVATLDKDFTSFRGVAVSYLLAS